MRYAIGMAIFWSAAGLVVLAPLLFVIVRAVPDWWSNVLVWGFVIIPGVGGALAFGPAWYYRRRKLLQQEGLTASGQASESPSPSAPQKP